MSARNEDQDQDHDQFVLSEQVPAYPKAHFEPAQERDLLRRINRRAEGVIVEGQQVAIQLPNEKRYGLEFIGDGKIITPSDVVRWVHLP